MDRVGLDDQSTNHYAIKRVAVLRERVTYPTSTVITRKYGLATSTAAASGASDNCGPMKVGAACGVLAGHARPECRVGARTGRRVMPGQSSSGAEVVVDHVGGDLRADLRALDVGRAGVDAAPDAGLDDLRDGVREAAEVPGGTRGFAVCAERDVVAAEEVRQCRHARRGEAGVSRREVGVRRRDEERHPSGVGHGGRVAVGVGQLDRGDRPPEHPGALLVVTGGRGVGLGEVDHREHPRRLQRCSAVASSRAGA